MRALFALVLPLLLLVPGTAEAKKKKTPQEVAVPAPVPLDLPSSTVLATWTGGQLTWGDVEEELAPLFARLDVEYVNQRNELLKTSIDDAVVQRLLEAEVARRGLADMDALVQAELNAVAEPTEEEARAYLQSEDLEVSEAYIAQARSALLEDRQRQRLSALVEKVQLDAAVRVWLARPEVPRVEVGIGTNPVRGNAEAPVLIVEFADYQCPFCARGYQVMKRVMETYGDRVAWVFRDMPLGFHDRAIPAAMAANCAGEQGRYWEMHDLLFEGPSAFSDEELAALATRAGVDMKAWEECRAAGTAAAEILRDMTDAQAAGVNGTPQYFINGILLTGAQPFEAFQAIIDEELRSR